jgi:hypothetical protein
MSHQMFCEPLCRRHLLRLVLRCRVSVTQFLCRSWTWRNPYTLRIFCVSWYRAYNLGNQLKADPSPRGLLYLVGAFLPIIGLWLQKLVYDARFYVGDDLSHRFYEVAVFLAIASSILHIRPVSELSHAAETPEMFAFSLSLAVGYFLASGRFVEIFVCQRLGCKGLYPEASAAAVHQLTTYLPPLALYTAATIYSGVKYYSYANSHSDYSSSSGYLNETDHGTDQGENATSNATAEVEGDTSHRWLAGSSSAVAYSTPTDDVTIWLLLAGALSSIVTMTFLVAFWLNPNRKPGFDPKTYVPSIVNPFPLALPESHALHICFAS